MAKLTKAQQAEQQESIELLRSMLKPNDVVYTLLRHCSTSGMRREISVYVVKDGENICLDYHVAKALNAREGKHNGIIQDGCGMDMGFHLVYNLGYTLWPNGTPEPHGRRNGEPDSDGGYALKQRWM